MQSGQPPPPSVELAAVLRRLFQLLLLVLSVQLCGLADTLACALELSSADQGCCSDCPTEKSGLGCPPGCRLCHCHQSGAVRLPELERTPLLFFPPESSLTGDWSGRAAPRPPFLSAIYRPPRALTLSV